MHTCPGTSVTSLQIVIARACFFTVLVSFSNPLRAPLTDRKNSCGGRASCILKYSRTWYSWCRRTKNIQDHPHLVETGDALQLFIYTRRTFTHATRKGVLHDHSRVQKALRALYYTWYSFTIFACSAYFYFALKDLRCIDLVYTWCRNEWDSCLWRKRDSPYFHFWNCDWYSHENKILQALIPHSFYHSLQ